MKHTKLLLLLFTVLISTGSLLGKDSNKSTLDSNNSFIVCGWGEFIAKQVWNTTSNCIYAGSMEFKKFHTKECSGIRRIICNGGHVSFSPPDPEFLKKIEDVEFFLMNPPNKFAEQFTNVSFKFKVDLENLSMNFNRNETSVDERTTHTIKSLETDVSSDANSKLPYPNKWLLKANFLWKEDDEINYKSPNAES